MKAICNNCGKSFQTYPSRKAKYCSLECAYIGLHNQIIVKCQLCGKEIVSRPDRIQKYCSNKCSALGRTTKIKEICINCGQEFYRKKSEINKKYCSVNCANEEKRKRRTPKICPICGKEYKTVSDFRHSRNVLYCSRECWKIGYHKKSYKKVCPICKKIFLRYERDKNSIYCSLECKHIDKTVIKYCPVCNKRLEIRKSHAHYTTYCSKECMRVAYRKSYMKAGYIKLDKNQHEIVDALLRFGATVTSMAGIKYGVPDILVGFRGKNYLMEIKNDSRKSKLTEAQIKWHKEWKGQVFIIRSIEDALGVLCDGVADDKF